MLIMHVVGLIQSGVLTDYYEPARGKYVARNPCCGLLTTPVIPVSTKNKETFVPCQTIGRVLPSSWKLRLIGTCQFYLVDSRCDTKLAVAAAPCGG